MTDSSGNSPVEMRNSFDESRTVGAVSLSIENLHRLPPEIERPRYDPAAVTPSILHIGPSSFSRAHIAKMAHDVLNKAADEGKPLDFGIKAVSLRSTDVKRALMPQDGLYCLTSKGAGVPVKHEVIGSIREVICAKENSGEIIAAAADPAIKIITMTVTQNGYNGIQKPEEIHKAKILDPNHPEFSTINLLVHSLDERRKKGLPIPVIVSLDNMDGNGVKLRNTVIKQASLIDQKLSEWISDHVPFVCSMVDRITPGKSEEHVSELAALGVKDNWPVLSEPMPQVPLVLEDLGGMAGDKGRIYRYSGIMELAKAGAIFSPNVARYESMKLRMLNGAHMALGCVGTLCGHKTSEQAMADPLVRTYVSKFMDQVIGTLQPIPHVDYNAYKEELITRLDNPHICDPLTRLARNGISKVNDRLLAVARDAMAGDKPRYHVTFAVAAWLQYAGNLDADGFIKETPGAKEPNDKDAKAYGFVADIQRNRHAINGVFHSGHEKVWGQDLIGKADFINTVRAQFDTIESRGIRHALEILTGKTGAPAAPAYRSDLH